MFFVFFFVFLFFRFNAHLVPRVTSRLEQFTISQVLVRNTDRDRLRLHLSLKAGVVGAPQMISQPFFYHDFTPFCYALYCPLGLGELQACPLPDVVFPPLFQSALSSSPFHCVHYKVVLARVDERETCPYHFSLRFFTTVRSSCGLIACWISAQTSW